MMLSGADERAFGDRGLDLELAIQLGAKFEAGKFLFDYRKGGALLFRKVRTQDKKFWIEPSGAPLQFWGLEEVPVLPSRPSEPLVITEGEFDRIAVLQSCGGYALSVPNGAAGRRSEGDIVIAEDKRFSYLWQDEKLIPEVEQFDRVILATDQDEPGTILRDELAIRIGETRCWYVTYPQGCKDTNDVLKAHGPAAVQELLAGAKPIRPGHLVKPSEIPPTAMQITYSSGWEFLDKHLMFVRPELVIVTGEPGHGKGQFLRCLALKLATAHGWRTAFLTPEDPAYRLKRDMRTYRMPRYATHEQQREAIEWIDNHFRISRPPEDTDLTLDIVVKEMESAALHHDCQVFVIDPWNEISHQFRKGETETLYIDRVLRELKQKARRYNIVLIIAAHPTKLPEDKQANLWSISGSAAWRNKADHGIILVRANEHAREVELVVEKCKDHATMGVPGRLWLEFNRAKCDYSLAIQERAN
jgi:twinkle protein